jgi:hypothetical protein
VGAWTSGYFGDLNLFADRSAALSFTGRPGALPAAGTGRLSGGWIEPYDNAAQRSLPLNS